MLHGITGLHAAQVAGRLRRERPIDVEIVRSHDGESKTLVEGETVIDGGAAGDLGVLPSRRKVIAAGRTRLSL